MSVDVPSESPTCTPPDSATVTPTSPDLSHRRHARAVVLTRPLRSRSIKKRLERQSSFESESHWWKAYIVCLWPWTLLRHCAAGKLAHVHHGEKLVTFVRARWDQAVRLFCRLGLVIISGFWLACSILTKPQRLLYACRAAVAYRFLPFSYSSTSQSTSAVSKSTSAGQTSPMAFGHEKRATVRIRVLTDVLKLLLVVCVTWMVWKAIELPADCSLLPVLMPPTPCGHSGQGLMDILKEDHGYTAGSPRYYFLGK